MKQIVQKLCIILAMLGLSTTMYAYDFEVDGIYYNKLSDGKSVAVTCKDSNYNSYSGSVTIPSQVYYSGTTYTVTYIGYKAFYKCSGLTSVTIPNSVTDIVDFAFYVCTGLKSVTIPNSVTYIGEEAFYGTPFYNNQPDGVVYLGRVLYKYKGTMPANTSISIKDGIISISLWAFYNCTGLTSVTIPNSVTYIDGNAFTGCISLEEIIVDNGNTVYDSRDNCNAIIKTTTNTLFKGCKTTVIPNSVTSIGGSAFRGCSGLTSVAIPNSVTSIGGNAFRGCSGLTSVAIPNSVTSIGGNAFAGCISLEEIIVDNGNTVYDSRDNCNAIIETTTNTLIVGCKTTVIPNSVTSIGYEAFYKCSGLTSVTIPNSVTSIGYSAFENCSGLTSVTIPNSVTKIGNRVFSNCSGLTSVTIGNSVNEIGNDVFDACNIAKIIWLPTTPPSGYKAVDANIHYVANDNYVFNNQIKYQFLGSLFTVDGTVYVPVIPSERTCDAIDCTYSPEYKSIVIADKIYNKGVEMTVLNVNSYTYFNNSNIESISIYNQGEVGEYAFGNCTSLTDIEISKSVSSIGDYAFTNCLALCNVTIEDCDTMLILGSNGSSPLFVDCPLNDVYIGRQLSYYKHVTDACYYPFARNTSLRTVAFSNNTTQIYDYEFYGCSGLQSLKIGESVSKIGDKAFSGCTGLTSFTTDALTPPICGNQALDDINKWECTLYVPAESIGQYKVADQWKDFFFIEESGIEDIIVDADTSDAPVEYYNLQGIRVENPANGIYIRRQGSTTTKVSIK